MLTANIAYATITGNNEEIADDLCDCLRRRGVKVSESEIATISLQAFQQADILAVCVYTYDRGALPDESLAFFNDLKQANLSGKTFGVAGSGDKGYGKYYNLAVDQFTAAFARTGARLGAPSLKIDLEPDDEDIEMIDQFAASLIKTANGKGTDLVN